jgi:GxxExxY protein
MEINELTGEIIRCAIEVHRTLGPGLFESCYEECLAWELRESGLIVEQQKPVPVVYKGNRLDLGYRIDILVNDLVIIELKSVEELSRVHQAQVLTYMKFSGKDLGLLINFNVSLLKDGIKRYRQFFSVNPCVPPCPSV